MQILSPFPGLLVKFKIEGDQEIFPLNQPRKGMLTLLFQINGKHYHGISLENHQTHIENLY